MNTKKITEYLLAGGIVYAGMAACSAPSVGRTGNGTVRTPQAVGGALSAGKGAGGAQGPERAQGGAQPGELGGSLAVAGALGAGGTQGVGGTATQGQGGSEWSPVPDASAQTSGSRLKAIFLVGDDGSRQFLRWHDSLLGVDCTFVPDGVGVTRCIPNADTYFAAGYVDAQCTVPYFDHDCADALYAWDTTDRPVCAKGRTEWLVYKLRPLPSGGQFFAKGVGTCVPKAPSTRLHFLGELQPAGIYVSSVERAQ